MKLLEIKVEGFKCFKDLTTIPIENVAVLIGENDAGKSSILRAIELLLTKQNPNIEEFFTLKDNILEEFTLEAKFEITDKDNKVELKDFIINNHLQYKKKYKKGEVFKTTIQKTIFVDNRLENYLALPAEPIKQLLIDLGIAELPNQDARRQAIKNYIEINWAIIPKTTAETEISFNDIYNYTPIYQYYGSHIYGNPQALVKKTLDSIYASHFYDETGNLKLNSIRGLKDKILNNINKSIEEKLLSKINIYNPNITRIQGRLDIDFSKGLDFQGLELDEGNGFKLIDQKGEGSKKRLFLSILEWDKEIQANLINSRAVIRAYDEPDSNLHYEAQRKMFNAITDVAKNPKSNTQSIIATHSIAMIDRAPSNSIIHVLQNNGVSTINYLQSDGDIDIQNFLNQISVIGGIKNSSIFYEKCFLLVEGESEESAIPKIYRKLFNRTLSESGVVLINLKSNGAWFNFLKLLHRNKKNVTVMLLDTDTQNPGCGANVTVAKLNEIGYDADFLANNVFFAGTQEFEDIFSNNIIREVFNNLYPKPTRAKWTKNQIENIRINNPKLSKGLLEASKQHIAHHKKIYKKPEFASKLADLISIKDLKTIPILTDLFNKVHQIAD